MSGQGDAATGRQKVVMITIRCTPEFRSRFREWARGRREYMEGAALRLCKDAMQSESDTVVSAARKVLEWYDRDGSVGGVVDPIEALRSALGKAE